tara:strand:+ start:39411 stop:39863 length:453 start_codon:yes stop_codon:yes gene_type:complete
MDIQPSYQLAQKLSKIICVKLVSLSILSGLFYIGILIIISLLELPAEQETILNLGSLGLLVLLIILGLILGIKRGKKKYLFFHDRIVFNKEHYPYSSIVNTAAKQGFLDKMFKTYSIKLNSDLTLRNISEDIDMKTYLDQLMQFSQSRSK